TAPPIPKRTTTSTRPHGISRTAAAPTRPTAATIVPSAASRDASSCFRRSTSIASLPHQADERVHLLVQAPPARHVERDGAADAPCHPPEREPRAHERALEWTPVRVLREVLLVAHVERPQLLHQLPASRLQLGRLVAEPPLETGGETEQ